MFQREKTLITKVMRKDGGGIRVFTYMERKSLSDKLILSFALSGDWFDQA